MLTLLARQLVQKQINWLFTMAENHQQAFQSLDGKTIAVEVTDLQLDLQIEFSGNQIYFLDQPKPKEFVSVTISGKSSDFFQTAINQSQSKSIVGLNFSGDISTGQKLQKLTEELVFDWEAQLAKYTNDYIAYHSIKVLKKANDWLKQVLSSKLANTSEILIEEWRLTPSPYEIEKFIEKNQQLQWAIDRVNARVQRLQQSIKDTSYDK